MEADLLTGAVLALIGIVLIVIGHTIVSDAVSPNTTMAGVIAGVIGILLVVTTAARLLFIFWGF